MEGQSHACLALPNIFHSSFHGMLVHHLIVFQILHVFGFYFTQLIETSLLVHFLNILSKKILENNFVYNSWLKELVIFKRQYWHKQRKE